MFEAFAGHQAAGRGPQLGIDQLQQALLLLGSHSQLRVKLKQQA
jgi:hypothetical protein